MAIVAEHTAFFMLSMASRAGHIGAVMVRSMGVGIVRILRLSLRSERFVVSMASNTSLVARHNERIACHCIFLRMANATFFDRFMLCGHLSRYCIAAKRNRG